MWSPGANMGVIAGVHHAATHLRVACSSVCVWACSRCRRARKCSSLPALCTVFRSSSALYAVCFSASDHDTEPLKEAVASADQLVCSPMSLACTLCGMYKENAKLSIDFNSRHKHPKESLGTDMCGSLLCE